MSNSQINTRLDQLIKEYWEVFEDMFPTMNFQDESKEEICNRIEQCLKQNMLAEDLFDLNNDYEY